MSNIKINDVPQRIQYLATAGQTQFSIPFPFFQNNYVVVWQDGVQLFPGASPGQYGITGAGSPSGGLLTLVTPALINSIITIEGIMPIDRTSIYSATISNLTGSDLNGDFNREVVMIKQIETTQAFLQLQYAPWAVISQDQTVTKDRYIPLLPALGAWRMNEAATAIETFQTPSSGGIAPDDATYILQVADSELPNAQAMGALASGLVVNTHTSGVQVTRLLEAVANQLSITNPDGIAGNPLYGFAPNARFPGTEGLGIVQGTTAQRPVTPVGTNLRFNTDLIVNEYWDGSNWVQLSESDGVITAEGTANQILVNGGTAPVDGAVIFTLSPTLNLPGSFNIQGTNAVTAIINDPSMATATTSNLSSSAAIKAYVDSLVTGLNIQGSCVCASTVALTVTYANGASGVGATLTNAGVQAAIQLDGVSPNVGQRVLIKNQASSLQNGIYTVTTVGSGATNWVLTRATDYDTPSEVAPGDLVILTGGTTQSQSSWIETATVAAIGTDPITFVQFTASLPVNVASGGTGVTSFSAYQIIAGGLTSTGSLQQLGIGSLGQMLRSQGAGALAAYSTTTYPDTNAINTIMYATSANVLGVITPVNSAVLISSAGGVPSMSRTLPAGLTIPTPIIGQINDANGLPMLIMNTTASAVNQFNIKNTQTGFGPTLSVTGTDADISIGYLTKGAGIHLFETTSNIGISMLTGTAYQHQTNFAFANTSANRTVTFPDADGTVAFAAGAGGLKSFQVFTSGTAQTYTRPAGITSILVEVVGGGGGGGGSTGGVAAVSVGGGGASGGYARLWVASASSSYTYTVGAGGAGGTAGANTGSTGGTTTFNASSLQATGGAGGGGMTAVTGGSGLRSIGGVAGVGTNGNINSAGKPGIDGFAAVSATTGGTGGSSIYGGGAVAQNATTTGNAASAYGSGGSGGLSLTVSSAGGAGSAGVIIVWEFA